MKRNEKQLAKKIKHVVKPATARGILPFKERPSKPPADAQDGKANLAASELFSLFTADIIREQKLFTR